MGTKGECVRSPLARCETLDASLDRSVLHEESVFLVHVWSDKRQHDFYALQHFFQLFDGRVICLLVRDVTVSSGIGNIPTAQEQDVVPLGGDEYVDDLLCYIWELSV
jgi:hypothetical protein